jgi:hypothetical protein
VMTLVLIMLAIRMVNIPPFLVRNSVDIVAKKVELVILYLADLYSPGQITPRHF